MPIPDSKSPPTKNTPNGSWEILQVLPTKRRATTFTRARMNLRGTSGLLVVRANDLWTTVVCKQAGLYVLRGGPLVNTLPTGIDGH